MGRLTLIAPGPSGITDQQGPAWKGLTIGPPVPTTQVRAAKQQCEAQSRSLHRPLHQQLENKFLPFFHLLSKTTDVQSLPVAQRVAHTSPNLGLKSGIFSSSGNQIQVLQEHRGAPDNVEPSNLCASAYFLESTASMRCVHLRADDLRSRLPFVFIGMFMVHVALLCRYIHCGYVHRTQLISLNP